VIGNGVGIGPGANLYNMANITIEDFAVISQGTHLCGGSHDYNATNFQLIAKPIHIGRFVWVCADAFIGLGVSIPEGAVIGARSVVTKSLPFTWSVYAGNPCRKVGERKQCERGENI
jgi:putative colanic acid biosynthesis acetyltransferase WcaF